MKALTFKTHGAPWDVVSLVDLPDPTLQPGTALIALEAAPVHIADLIAIWGKDPFFPIQPGVPGFEGVGRILQCADDIEGWQPGDRVFLPIGFGAWQTHHVVRADQLLRAPENVAAAQLALVPINLSTAYVLLHAYDALEAGDSIIQNAANSNVASYVSAVAARKGIEVIHVVRRPELVDALQAEGRTHVLLDGPDLAGRVDNIAAEKPRMAFDAIGGDATARLGSCVADHGLVLSYGFLSKQPHQIDYVDLMFRGVRLRGMMTNWGMDRLSDADLKAMHSFLFEMVEAEHAQADIAGVYTFAEVDDALRHAAKTGRERKGKIILVPE